MNEPSYIESTSKKIVDNGDDRRLSDILNQAFIASGSKNSIIGNDFKEVFNLDKMTIDHLTIISMMQTNNCTRGALLDYLDAHDLLRLKDYNLSVFSYKTILNDLNHRQLQNNFDHLHLNMNTV